MKCHVCGCTQDRACPVGCGWAHKHGEEPLCSVCAEFLDELREYIERANAVTKASLGRLYDLAATCAGIAREFR